MTIRNNNSYILAKLVLVVFLGLSSVLLVQAAPVEPMSCTSCCEKAGNICYDGCAWWNVGCMGICAWNVSSCTNSCIDSGNPNRECGEGNLPF
jgi:hypothetical protein